MWSHTRSYQGKQNDTEKMMPTCTEATIEVIPRKEKLLSLQQERDYLEIWKNSKFRQEVDFKSVVGIPIWIPIPYTHFGMVFSTSTVV